MTTKTLAKLLGASLLLAAAPLAAIDRGDPSAGREIAEGQCMACHAVDGSAGNPEWPILAGQHPDYLVRSLRQYKDGTRENAIMQGQASGLSLQDMRDVAAYYARQEGELYTPER